MGRCSRVSVLVAAVAVAAGLLAVTPAYGHGPTPACSWTSSTYLRQVLGVRLRLKKPGPYNGTLGCDYTEVHPKYTFKKTFMVEIQYITFSSYTYTAGDPKVSGIGSCQGGSCPTGNPNDPSELSILRAIRPGKRKGKKYTQREWIYVQDGSNTFAVGLLSYEAPLPKKNETAQIEKIARKLAPLFYDNV